MKRIIFWTIIIVCLSTLCACRPANLETQVPSVANIQPAPTIANPSDIQLGMSLEDVFELYPEEAGSFNYCSHLFFCDREGNPVVATYPRNAYAERVILSITTYDKDAINVSEEAFRSIEPGMSIYDVVSLVGHPNGGPALDGLTLVWHCDDGETFHVEVIFKSDNPSVLTVTNVYRLDKITGNRECISCDD